MLRVQRLGSRGWVTLLGGVGLIFLGVLIFSLIYEVLEVRSRVVGYVAVGMAITGIGNIAWGASALSRARRIRNRLQESEV